MRDGNTMWAAAVVVVAAWALLGVAPPAEAQSKKRCPEGQVADGQGRCVGDHTCPEGMVPIPAGTFTMGLRGAKDDRGPTREVTVSAFCMDRTEVTTGAWLACERAGRCDPARRLTLPPGYEGEPPRSFCNIDNLDREGISDHPINCMSWANADQYCRAQGKRLPTEAEWEYAARGSDNRRFPWGNQRPTRQHGHWSTGRLLVDTAPVGTYPRGASAFGLLDMAGNVCELVADRYAARYPSEAQSDPRGPATGDERVCRGGSLNNRDADAISATFRRRGSMVVGDDLTGFRCASDP